VFVKNGQTKKEVESHGMALPEMMEYYNLKMGMAVTKVTSMEEALKHNDTWQCWILSMNALGIAR
jgi:hypothetical protein